MRLLDEGLSEPSIGNLSLELSSNEDVGGLDIKAALRSQSEAWQQHQQQGLGTVAGGCSLDDLGHVEIRNATCYVQGNTASPAYEHALSVQVLTVYAQQQCLLVSKQVLSMPEASCPAESRIRPACCLYAPLSPAQDLGPLRVAEG